MIRNSSRVGNFCRSERGGGTVMSLFVVVIIAVLMSLGLDATNGWRNRTYLTSVADMGAHAGAVAIAHKKTDEEIIADVQMVIETNMPTDFWGNVVDADTDIVLADYDVETKTWSQGTLYRPNAVIVHVERTKSRGNAVSTFLMQFVGINSLDVQAVSAGVFDRSGLCSATDGIYGVGRVRISSQGYFGATMRRTPASIRLNITCSCRTSGSTSFRPWMTSQAVSTTAR